MTTGLFDSNGLAVGVGDIVRTTVTVNVEYHGQWADYEVKLRGATPILSYVRSEKGQRMPVGYTAQILAEQYDSKQFLFGDLNAIRPVEEMTIVRCDRMERLKRPASGD